MWSSWVMTACLCVRAGPIGQGLPKEQGLKDSLPAQQEERAEQGEVGGGKPVQRLLPKTIRVVTPGRLAGLCSRSILEIDCQNM